MSSDTTGITIHVMLLIAFMKQVVLDKKIKESESTFKQRYTGFVEY